MEPAIALSGVTRRFGDVVAVHDLDLRVQPGEVLGVLGPNGSGKSTTLRMVLGMLVPTDGIVRVLGGPPGLKARRRMGYLPEQRGLYEEMRALDQLVWFARMAGVPAREARTRAMTFLERVGLADRATDRLSDFSKGMQQRVQLGTALLHQPPVVVLDEPFSGLDPVSQDVFGEVVADEKARGAAILLCTHELTHAQQVCDRAVVIIKGHKRLDGEVRALRREAGEGRLRVEGPGVAEALAGEGLVAEEGVVQLPHGRDGQWLLEVLLAEGVVPERFERADPSLHEIVVKRIRDWEDA